MFGVRLSAFDCLPSVALAKEEASGLNPVVPPEVVGWDFGWEEGHARRGGDSAASSHRPPALR